MMLSDISTAFNLILFFDTFERCHFWPMAHNAMAALESKNISS
jgi:hypothetical protein